MLLRRAIDASGHTVSAQAGTSVSGCTTVRRAAVVSDRFLVTIRPLSRMTKEL